MLSSSSSASCSLHVPSSHRRQAPFSIASLSDLIDALHSHDELTAKQHEQQRQHSATLLDHLRTLHSFCSELQHRNAALSRDFDGLTAVHRQLQTEYGNVSANNATLQDELVQCRRERKEEVERMEVERIRQTATLSDMSRQLVAITASHQQKEQALASVTRERDGMRARIQTLEEELADSSNECEQLSSQLRAAEEERDEWVEEGTRLETRLKASESETERIAEAKERVERELQAQLAAHLDIAATIHGLSQKAMASRGGSKAKGSSADAGERVSRPRTVLGELDANRT